MTQDQYGQARGPGYVVRGDVVPDDETEEFPTEEPKPMTRFEKVASALRGGGPEQDEQDQLANQDAADQAAADQAAHSQGDYWDEAGASGAAASGAAASGAATSGAAASRAAASRAAASGADRDEAVAVTSPDVPLSETGTDPLTRQDQVTGQPGPDAADHPATQPDMFGTTAHAGNGTTSEAFPEGQADTATTADVSANGAQANGVPTESRPGEAAGVLGDFSDLTYGNLIPDAAQYNNQWHQVQFKFVDDPRASVTEAADIITQVTARLEAAIQERQRAIEERQRAIAEQQRSLRGRWGEGTNADTEGLRETLRMYRTFLDQLIGPRAG
jgi:hypothetical protein